MLATHRVLTLAAVALVLLAVPLLAPTQPTCVPVPIEPPRDTSCDDGTPLECTLVQPDCGDQEIPAIQDGCWRCVNPETCLPWGVAECRSDLDCPPEEFCNPCGTSSCPVCRDCVAACTPHGCRTEPEPACNLLRPDCGEGQTAVVRDGCWVCVGLDSCSPVLPDVQCGTIAEVFPDFSRRCEMNADCALVFHLVNCCGTQVAWGIRADEVRRFEEAEAECRSQMYACGCPSFPTEADDGNTHWDHTAFAARCQENRCSSYVPSATDPPR